MEIGDLKRKETPPRTAGTLARWGDSKDAGATRRWLRATLGHYMTRKQRRRAWGSMPVDQLRPVHLREWLLTLPAATADTALLTLRKIYGTVSGFVVLPIDPFAATVKYTMPTRKTRERSKRLYTFAEAKGHSGPPARNLARGAVHHGVLWIMSLRRAAGHLHRRGSAVRGGIHNARNGRPRAPDGASGHRAHGGRRTQDAEVNAHSRGAAGCRRAPARNCRRAPRGRLRVASRSRGRTAHEPIDVQS